MKEFARVVPLFEQAFQEHMNKWRLDSKPRAKRAYTTPLFEPGVRAVDIYDLIQINSNYVPQKGGLRTKLV